MASIRLLSRPFLAAFLNGRSCCSGHRIPTPWETILPAGKEPSAFQWMSSNPGSEATRRQSAPIFCVKSPQIPDIDFEGSDFDGEGGGEKPEHSFPPSVKVGESDWAPVVLRCVEQVLGETHSMENLDLFSFNVKEAARKVEIRLDKRDNKFGSPGLEDIQEFSGALSREMEDEMGEEEAGSIEVEVSSPGAEREVRFPEELDRFKHLPMQVEYVDENDECKNRILNLDGLEKAEGVISKSIWKIADTKAGRFARKGRKLNKKDRETIIQVEIERLKKVNLYLDV